MVNPKVSIVILNWNGRKHLETFLPSVVSSTYINKEIIVADNASTDDSIAFIKENYPSIRIIINPENEGFAKGYNTALKQVDSEYYVLLNSDVEVTPNWIEPVIELMETDQKIGACQPKLLSYLQKDTFEYAGASGGWIDNWGYPFSRGRVFDECEKDMGQYDDAQPCFWASGAAMFVRSSVYHEVGGLDEYFFAHQEEIDLCWRMQRKGYKVFVQPSSVVYHLGGGTLPVGNNRKVYLNFRNNLIMLAKNLPLSVAIWKIPIRFCLDALAAYKEVIKGDFGYWVAIAKAHLGFAKWLFFIKKDILKSVKSNQSIVGWYSGSIIKDFYIQKKKRFSEIISGK